MLQLERHSGDEGILLFLGEDSSDDTDLQELLFITMKKSVPQVKIYQDI